MRDIERGTSLIRRAINLERLSGVRLTADRLSVQVADGKEFIWDPGSLNSLLTLLTHGTVEEKETKFVTRTVSAGATVIDCGANFGWYTVHMARLVGEKGSVHSFEPVPSAARLLEENVRINRCGKNVQINRMAVGDYCGKGEIWVPTREGAGAAFASFQKQTWGPHEKVVCDVITLDHYVSQLGLNKIDFVKCDVEGAELSVLRGARKILESGIRPIWMLEIVPGLMKRFGYALRDLWRFLSSFEYKVCVLDDQGTPRQIKDFTEVGKTEGHNFVALPTEFDY